jgi:hypothetical protein
VNLYLYLHVFTWNGEWEWEWAEKQTSTLVNAFGSTWGLPVIRQLGPENYK